jgi:RNA polymerase primary sigma factor
MKHKTIAKQDLEKMIAVGKRKGFLTYDEVNDLLSDEIVSPKEIDLVFDLLGSEDIKIVNSEENFKEELAKEEVPLEEEIRLEKKPLVEKFMPLDDPVKMYLKQMGSISLLSREDELILAKKIEEAENKFKEVVLSTRLLDRNYYGL